MLKDYFVLSFSIPITIISVGELDRNKFTDQLLQTPPHRRVEGRPVLVGHIKLDDFLTIHIARQKDGESPDAPQDTELEIIGGIPADIALLDKGIDYILVIAKKFINSTIKIGGKTFSSQTDLEELKKEVHNFREEIKKLEES